MLESRRQRLPIRSGTLLRVSPRPKSPKYSKLGNTCLRIFHSLDAPRPPRESMPLQHGRHAGCLSKRICPASSDQTADRGHFAGGDRRWQNPNWSSNTWFLQEVNSTQNIPLARPFQSDSTLAAKWTLEKVSFRTRLRMCYNHPRSNCTRRSVCTLLGLCRSSGRLGRLLR